MFWAIRGPSPSSEQTDGALEIAPLEIDAAQRGLGFDAAVGVVGLLRDLDRGLTIRDRVGEMPERGEADREPRSGPGREVSREARVCPHRFVAEDRHGLSQEIDRAADVAHGEVRLGQPIGRFEMEIAIPEGGRDRASPSAGVERSSVVARVSQSSAHVGDDVAEPPIVVKLARENFGLAETVDDLLILSERSERGSQVESQIDAHGGRLRGRRETTERLESLLEAVHCLAVGGTRRRLRSGPSEILDRLVPYLAAKRVMGQPVDVFGRPVREEPLDRGENLRV
jgi:hypothetical protein